MPLLNPDSPASRMPTAQLGLGGRVEVLGKAAVAGLAFCLTSPARSRNCGLDHMSPSHPPLIPVQSL